MTTEEVLMKMARRRLGQVINSQKHVIDSQGGLVAGTQQEELLVDAVDAPALADTNGVAVGSHIYGLFLNIQVAATGTAALANVYMAIIKNPGNNLGNPPNANALGASDYKRQVFHQEMIMTEKNTTAIPRTLFKGVLKIPKTFHTMRRGDRIELLLFAPGVNFDYCVQCIYKEFR